MSRRTDLVLIAAGPVLAVSLLAVNAVAGRAVVEAVYVAVATGIEEHNDYAVNFIFLH